MEKSEGNEFMSQVLLNAVPPACAAMARNEFPQGLLNPGKPRASSLLNIGLLNLMPTKEVTERQWLRLLLRADFSDPLQLHFLKLNSWRSTHVSPLHMSRYYQTIEDALLANHVDVLIITGAPLGRLEYSEVGYWPELTALMCELEVRGIAVLFSCWAAQAALYHLYGIPTLRGEEKLSGVFAQQLLAASGYPASTRSQRLAQRLADSNHLDVPQSRFALPDPAALAQRLHPLQAEYLRREHIPQPTGQPTGTESPPVKRPLTAILGSRKTGISVLSDERKGHLFMLGHPEYEDDTLALEYTRDLAHNPATPAPVNYQLPAVEGAQLLPTQSAQWQTLGAALIENWLTYR